MENSGIYKFECFKDKLSQESFSDFFDFYYARLNKFAIAIVDSRVLAEEIVLDVFLKLWEHKSVLHTIRNIETYLFISVRNTAVNALKKEQKFTFDMLQDAHIQVADYKQTADNQLIEHEMLQLLNETVNLLPPQCKIIFKLIREDGFNRNEVAQILNISAKTVDNQIAIAIAKIAARLQIDLSHPRNSSLLTSFLLTL
ncbi:MAG: RNA polymerase sigma-70 factor [Tannerellaceae bacterium]|jgi:RNA polymerase sigma-70 factor (ECF subfamily)|nr:RNA polymerase sigma-70 factor [Tannerellaceae bacterium]